eukprot:TRINITY_DN5430_c0_g1_i2.p1 TRINITY_DN5430_c0_g1~~TRINITY_DN5430_c0_g1_i2.p1  ORF type:complete len:341 (-),score=62.53 TRINITY_DN5430_c0_g1_i2:29-1051(-)
MKRPLSELQFNSSCSESIREIARKIKRHNSGMLGLMAPAVTYAETDSTPELRHSPFVALDVQVEEYYAKLLKCEETIVFNFLSLPEERSDARFCSEELCEEIVELLKSSGSFVTSGKQYMHLQSDINENMRAVVVDWIIDVNETFSFCADTVFTSVAVLDRFLGKRKVSVAELQLAGVTSVIIAAKFHETTRPPVGSFVVAADNLFTEDEVCRMELEMLKVIGYSLDFRHPLTLMDCYWEEINNWIKKNRTEMKFMEETVDVSAFVYNYTMYLLYSQLAEYELLKFPSSLILAGALLIAVKEANLKWNLENVVKYRELSLIHICRCRRLLTCRSRWSPYH